MNNSILIETDKTGENNIKLVLPAHVRIDLKNIETAALLEEMGRRGIHMNSSTTNDESSKFVSETVVRAFDILAAYEARNMDKAALSVGELIRDVLHQLKPEAQ